MNGRPLKTGETVALKPGDYVTMPLDVGDSYPVWETRNVLWGLSEGGMPMFGQQILSPGTAIDFTVTDKGTKVAGG